MTAETSRLVLKIFREQQETIKEMGLTIKELHRLVRVLNKRLNNNSVILSNLTDRLDHLERKSSANKMKWGNIR